MSQLASVAYLCHISAVEIETITFEELQRDKREARLLDEQRLARGEVTPQQLEEENSYFCMDAPIEIPKLWEALAKYYSK